MLNASKRKSKFVLSVIGNFFSAEESRLISSGPRSMFLPELPQWYQDDGPDYSPEGSGSTFIPTAPKRNITAGLVLAHYKHWKH